jgi:hypothetical protein
MYDRLLQVFESFLGVSQRGVSENGQAQFPCPFCGSGKSNLEVNFIKGVYKSWCCVDQHGSVFRLIKQFGNEYIFQSYKNEIQNIKDTYLYEINHGKYGLTHFGKPLMEIPECCEKLSPEKRGHKKAFEYCVSRNISLDMINKYNIQCTTFDCVNKKMKQRIIIPSYDNFQQLNYWVGRIYHDNKYQTKYINPTGIDKKKIIFNEHLLQYDGEIRLVEGSWDSIVVPNSTAILGKELDSSFYLHNVLTKKATNILLMPDRDAVSDWLKIGAALNTKRLYGKIKIVDWDKFKNTQCKDIKDTSDVFKWMGYKGIASLIKTAQII